MKKVVYCYFAGELLHIGHLKHLQKARQYGDYVIAGILTRNAIQEKKVAPVTSYKERAVIFKAIRYVDRVVKQTTYSPIPNILKFKPNIVMESTSHKKEDIDAVKKAVKSYGGRVIINPYYPKQSSTKIKNKIRRAK